MAERVVYQVDDGDLDGALVEQELWRFVERKVQRNAFAQIVVTLLQRSEVGQVSFTIDGEIVPVPVESGSKETAAVSDFAAFLGAPRSSIEPGDETITNDVTTTSGPLTSVAD